MKILHAADLHIDSPLRGLGSYEGAPVEEIRGATRRAVENLVDVAIANDVDLIVLAGDVFDGDWKDYSTGLFWVNQLARLRDEEIPVVLVAGNHDAASEVSRRLTLPPNVTQLSSAKPEVKRFDDLNLAVVGQSYASKSVSVDLAATYPVADPGLFTIGLLHTSLDGRPGHADYAPSTLDVLRGRGYQYWALGHVHQREVVATDPWVVFPGNLQGRQVRETGAKGASLITVEDGEVRTVEGLALDVVRWASCPVDVSAAGSFDESVAKAAEALDIATAAADGRLVAARVRIVGTTAAHADLWRRAEQLEMDVRALGSGRSDLWIEKVQLATKRPGTADTDLVVAIGARAQELLNDRQRFDELAATFADLRNKLPVELRSAEVIEGETPPPSSEQHIRDAITAAVELATSMLSEVEPS